MNYNRFEIAMDVIKNHAHRTPVLTTKKINQDAGPSLFFKCENFQKVGAFKVRGALYAISQLSDAEKAEGVATHSSGNHGAALAYAASLENIPSYVVMPSNAPAVKKAAVLSYGGHVVECEPTMTSRLKTLDALVEKNGCVVIPPYDDDNIIIGQGTVALEFIEQLAERGVELDDLVIPVGGGGLLAGCAVVIKNLLPNCKVIAAEPALADDTFQSFSMSRRQGLDSSNTIADGLRAPVGEKNFALIKQYVDDVLTVEDDEIINAMRLIWTRMKIIVEPSAAVGLAAVLNQPDYFSGKNVGLILTGGNVDIDHLPW